MSTDPQVRANTANLVDDPHGAAVYEEKPNIDHVEGRSIDEEKQLANANNGKVDYSGFAQKTDPKEIKLVKKLDLYIMVRLSMGTTLNL